MEKNQISRSAHTVSMLPRLAAIAATATVVSLCGCVAGPDYRRPDAPAVNGYARQPLPDQTAAADVAGGNAQRFVQGMDIPGQWWQLFHSQPLNAVIEEALRANPDLQSAQAALRVAQENAYAQRGAYYPNVNANLSPSRQKTSEILSPTLASNETLFNLHTAQLQISYTLDAFGGVRRQVESTQAQAEAQRFQLEATYLTLTSNVVAAVVLESSLRAQIAATEDIVRIGSEVLDLMQKQYGLGAIAMADIVAQRATLAQAQATLSPLRKQLAQQRNLLAALIGRFPSEELEQKFELSALELPQEIPVSLPSRLVEQRPDVQAAAAQLHAATAQVGVAAANMLPQISLNANVGSSATDFSQLFTTGNGFWSLIGNLTQPVFAGGSLLHKKRAAEAGLEQAAADYRSTVIKAFQNVADSLRALQYDAETLKAQVDAERAAAESLDIARNSLKLGATSYLSLLNAEQSYRQAVINRVQGQSNRYADTAALFQALGGGWWNRSDTALRVEAASEENRPR